MLFLVAFFVGGGARKLTWILKNGGLGKVTSFQKLAIVGISVLNFWGGTFSFGNPAVLKRLQLSKLLHSLKSADSFNL